MFNKYLLAVSVGVVFSISGCGGGSDNNEVLDPSVLTGVFEDSKVIGLNYRSGGISGVTNKKGQFKYKQGDTIEFSLGDLVLGSATGASTLNTFDIGDSFDRNASGDYTNIKIATLLQTLDANANPADGFIDLTGMVNSTSGLSLDNGVTKDLVDTIINNSTKSDKINVRSEIEVLNHATRSYYKAITEKNKSLNLEAKVEKEDVDSGHYRVGVSVGLYVDDKLIQPDASISIQSDLSIKEHSDLASGRVRNAIAFLGKKSKVYSGFGLSYRASSDHYGINFYVEEYDIATSKFIQEMQVKVLPAAYDDELVISKGEVYRTKLQYNASENVFEGYINGVKILTAPLPSGYIFDKAKVYTETRVSAPRDRDTGKAVSAGAKMKSTVDNLIISVIPRKGSAKVILSDDFNDNFYDNHAISYSNRYRK